MKGRRRLVLSYGLIFVLQVVVLGLTLPWYPDLGARLLLARNMAGVDATEQLLLVSALLLAPLMLVIAPYHVAHDFWRQLDRQRSVWVATRAEGAARI